MPQLQFDHVTKSYSDVVALRDVSFEARDGELLVLVGPSGCGKSTTLRLIAGLEEFESGTISIDGNAINNLPPKDRDIAMVFQSYALYPHMTVRQNLEFGLKMKKTPTDEIEQRVLATAQSLDIEDLLERKPGQLSGGQKQRVAVGRAMIRKPAVFLFDEPLSNLDTKLRVTLRDEMASLHQRLSATIIYVTHDQIEALTLGNRIAVMNEGQIQQIGTPQEIYQTPANTFVASFIGNPAMNLISRIVWGYALRTSRLVIKTPAAWRLLSLAFRTPALIVFFPSRLLQRLLQFALFPRQLWLLGTAFISKRIWQPSIFLIQPATELLNSNSMNTLPVAIGDLL